MTGVKSKDIVKKHPEKLHELQRLWLIEAMEYNVLPLDDRLPNALTPTSQAPQYKGNRQLLFGGMGGRKLDRQLQEQVTRRDGRGGRAFFRGGRRHHCGGRKHWRLEPMPRTAN